MEYIENPILRGFHPDPSIIRVQEDYYIATSTFEWFPGVQIYHSRDLKNWELVARPLSRVSQLDLAGVPDSGGVWAPCLSYSDGVYYLVYTVVKSVDGLYKDTHNYLVTATDICGDWSEPVYLNSEGFDPSLFHDTDGRKWLVNMTWDMRRGKTCFGGIQLREYSPAQRRLVGESRLIFAGTELGITEGPHLYHVNGYYYLFTAEGGTHFGHALTVARSKTIEGPYEADPGNPVLTSRDDVTLPLQRAGHADLVETQTGEWYIVHLAGRPIPTKGRCILGRETCLQKAVWTADGWLRLANGSNKPDMLVPAPDIAPHPYPPASSKDDFDMPQLDIQYQTLRIPADDRILSLTERPGFLRLRGRESLSSQFVQSLVARRQQAFCCRAETKLLFEPETFKQMAGLVCYYDTRNYYYVYLTCEEGFGTALNMICNVNWQYRYPLEQPVAIPYGAACFLRAEIAYDQLQFFYSLNGDLWRPIGPRLDHSTLSDEACMAPGVFGCFTGAFIGMCCQDLSGAGKCADFDYFTYCETENGKMENMCECERGRQVR